MVKAVNEIPSFGFIKILSLRKPAGAEAEVAFCVVIAFPKRQSPIARPRNRISRPCDDGLFFVRVQTHSIELSCLFIFRLSHSYSDSVGAESALAVIGPGL